MQVLSSGSGKIVPIFHPLGTLRPPDPPQTVRSCRFLPHGRPLLLRQPELTPQDLGHEALAERLLCDAVADLLKHGRLCGQWAHAPRRIPLRRPGVAAVQRLS